MIKTTYRDVEITFDEKNETWNCEVNTRRSSRTNLKDCKAAIDKFLDGEKKLKHKFDRFEVIKKDYSQWERLTVTSITDDAVWVTDARGNRQKNSEYDCKGLFLDTPENNAIIEQIKQKEADIKSANDQIRQLKASLSYLDPKQFLKQLI
jgi:hypothetical protein